MTKFLLDTNVFLEAQNKYYAQDIVPAFWDWMDTVFGNDFGTIEPVRDELLVKDDPLGNWIRDRKDAGWIFGIDDEPTQTEFAKIAAELDASTQYKRPAIEKFLSGADPWLIAKAKVLGATIVTREGLSPDAKSRVPIPNLCRPREVPFANTFDTLRHLKANFTLPGKR